MTPDVGSSQLLEIALWALWVTAVLRTQQHKHKHKDDDEPAPSPAPPPGIPDEAELPFASDEEVPRCV